VGRGGGKKKGNCQGTGAAMNHEKKRRAPLGSLKQNVGKGKKREFMLKVNLIFSFYPQREVDAWLKKETLFKMSMDGIFETEKPERGERKGNKKLSQSLFDASAKGRTATTTIGGGQSLLRGASTYPFKSGNGPKGRVEGQDQEVKVAW